MANSLCDLGQAFATLGLSFLVWTKGELEPFMMLPFVEHLVFIRCHSQEMFSQLMLIAAPQGREALSKLVYSWGN